MIVKKRNGEMLKVSDADGKKLVAAGDAVEQPTTMPEGASVMPQAAKFPPQPRAKVKAPSAPPSHKKITSPPKKKGSEKEGD